MANLNNPFGLRPVNGLSGQPYTGGARIYSVPSGDSTAIYIGDCVKIVGTGQIINGSPFEDVARAASGDVMCGVVIGVLPDTRDSLIYRAASTQRRVLVADDPHILFACQQANTGTPFTVNDIGLNTNLTMTAGSTVTGFSGVVLDNTAGATTNTLDVKLVGMVDRPDNDIGSSASVGTLASVFLIRLNRHQYVNQIAGA